MKPRSETNIPVMRPHLPPARILLPYLRRIDAARTYSNWGPLVAEFESRLAQRFGLARGAVVSASSGTLALVGATLALAGRADRKKKPLAIMPAFTFTATADAVEACGYEPFIVDVEPGTWMLDPVQILARVSSRVLKQTGVVVPVAPFGRPVPLAAWNSFRRQTGIPVVVDGAAAIEGICRAPERYIGDIPVAVSLHATKSLGIGEGGCVVTRNRPLARRAMQSLNYGFLGTRESTVAGSNGKMSEYHAAVGLASLDGWFDRTEAMRAKVATAYRRAFADAGLSARFISAPDVSSTYAIFHCRSLDEARQVERSLIEQRIDFRRWYGRGLHNHAHYAKCPRERDLAVTEELTATLIGLPSAPDLSSRQVARIFRAVTRGVGRMQA